MFGFNRLTTDQYDVQMFRMELIADRIHAMAIDLAKLNAAVARSVAASEKLLAAHTDPAAQVAVDAVADTLDAESVKAEAAVAPAV